MPKPAIVKFKEVSKKSGVLANGWKVSTIGYSNYGNDYLQSDKTLSLKEIILYLSPTLIKMRNKRFTIQELVIFLNECKISIKGATLNRYLNECLKEDKI